MDTDKIHDLARSVALLGDEGTAHFERSLHRVRVEMSASKQERTAKLRAMTDWDVVHSFLSLAQPDEEEVLETLRDAGFVRVDLSRLRSVHATLEEVFRRIVKEVPSLATSPDPAFHDVINRLILDAAVNLSNVEEAA